MIEPTDDRTPKSDEPRFRARGAHDGVGALLRASRIRCGEELPEVAEALRIRLCHLEAIEEGRFADLPGPAYVLGFVRTYANHLGLDSEEVTRRLRAETEIAVVKLELTFPVPLSDSSVPSGAVVMVGLLAATVAYGAYLAGTSRDGGQIARVSPVPERLARDSARIGASPPAATAASLPANEPVTSEPIKSAPAISFSPAAASPPSLSPSVATAIVPPSAAALALVAGAVPPVGGRQTESPPVPTATVAPAPAQVAVAVATPPPPVAPAKPPRIEVRAKADSWIQVRDGGAGEFLVTRLLREGETFAVPDRSGLTLLTGNAGALEIRVDGAAVPALGPEGAVRRAIALDVERLKQGTAASD
ncbi:MAG: RodZ domain-containing protein [Pseudomonadota bacterium]